MDTFLSKVAKVYLSNEADNLVDYCFIFPNKRSGVFFNRALTQLSGVTFVAPEITTISEFVSGMSHEVEASKTELLFVLYDVYKNLMRQQYNKSELVGFDQFRFWAEMLLNDFNDVDKYLVDAKMLFKNVKDLKEINSNFLTSEQIEVINNYWNENRSLQPDDEFWTHIKHAEDNLSDGFVKLWEILYDLYTLFKQRLSDSGLCYSGMTYRNAVNVLKKSGIEDLPYKRYIFIGFNVLSTSEIKIFERLQELGRADFYWDYDAPTLKNRQNKATRFLSRYVKLFKSHYSIDGTEIVTYSPKIVVTGVPSNVGQTKFIGNLLSKMADDGSISNPADAIDTAIVLPDESLFIPLIHSIPPEISTVNITMGYPMRYSSIATLISLIISMQLRGRIIHEKLQYYYEDIFSILSHPLVRAISTKECDAIITDINSNRKFNIEADYLTDKFKHLSPIFKSVKNLNNKNEIFTYTASLINWLKIELIKNNGNKVDIKFIEHYTQALETLRHLSQKYAIEMLDKTFFQLIEKIIGFETINFVGEPLNGLQVMGVLETRALDFKNIIILSMNDRIFPRKHYAKSFIPNSLRRCYGMATIEFQESMYAYYFYRLISKSETVNLIYDSRSGGLKSGEMSRFLYQLKYIYNSEHISFVTADYPINLPKQTTIQISKTDSIMNRLNEYKNPQSKKFLSASAINKYINCPLSFYLFYIEGLQYEDEVKDYMDESTYGTIIHEVAELLYKNLRGNAEEVVVTTEILEHLKNDSTQIYSLIIKSINKHYNKLGENNDTPLIGEAKVLSEIMLYFIQLMLEQEKQFAPFAFIDGESKQFGQWKITDDLTINFKYIIDRIDRLNISSPGNEYLRFVDYKTGSDKAKSKTIEELFNSAKEDRAKAILQLFAYCNAYAEFTGYKGAIQPYLYLFKTINTEHLPALKIDKNTIFDYREYNDEFMTHFRHVLVEMFDKNVPFKQAENSHACKYCKFTSICGRTLEK